MRVLRRAGDMWGGVLMLTVGAVLLVLLARAVAPLPLLSEAPAVVSVSPLDGAALREPLTVVFNTPMNRRSVERATRLIPATPVRFQWNDDTTLTVTPTEPLRPDTAYLVQIDANAQSRLFRPLQQPAVVAFRTVAGPQVAAVLPAPASDGVPISSALMVRFSRPLVPAPAPGTVQPFPALQIAPPVDGAVTWLSADTLIFRPAAPLAPATRYQVTIAPDTPALSDFGDPYRWTFTTLPPAVIAQSPPGGATGVAPNAPLSLRLSSSVDLALLQTTLAVTPAVPLSVEAALLPDATQQITITASGGWQRNTSYQVTAGQGLAGWSFRTAPPFGIVGRFPGEGQVLANGQELRLIFTTPIDPAALQAGVQFDPPTGPITVTARDTEARIQTVLQAATAYTLTLPADVTDRAGIALGAPFQARFLSAPATPAVALPDAANGLLRSDPANPTALVRRTNVSSLQLALFPLDDASLARLAAFSAADWQGFAPERAGLNAIRRWSVPLTDPLNRPAEDRVALLLDDGRPPDAGGYYLQLRTPEGPRADALLLLTDTRMALVNEGEQALVALTDARTGQPLALPVSLYQDGGLIASGATDGQGIWTASISQTGRIVAVGGGAVATSISRPPAASTAPIQLALDAEVYRSGESATVVVLADRQRTGEQVSLTLTERATGQQYWGGAAPVDADGLALAVLPLPAAPLGVYDVAATLGTATAQAPLALSAAQQRLALLPPIYRDTVALPLTLRTTAGAPVAGVRVRWQATRTLLPDVGGLTFGDDEQPVVGAPALEGSVTTDSAGRAQIELPRAAGPATLVLTAVALDADTPVAATAATFAEPARRGVGLSAARTVLDVGEPLELTVALRDELGQPASGTIALEIARRSWPATAAPDAPPRERIVVSQQVAVGETGRATVRIPLAGGEYRIRVQNGQQQAAIGAVVAAPSGEWSPASVWRFIADRPAPAAPVRLLAASRISGTALVTFQQAGVLTGTIRPVSAGTLLELPATGSSVQVQQWENETSRRTTVRLPGTVAPASGVSAIPITATNTLSITASTGAVPAAASGVIVARAATGGPAVVTPLTIDASGATTATAPLTATSALIVVRTASGEAASTRVSFPPAVASASLSMPPVVRAGDTIQVWADIAVPAGQTVRATLQGTGASLLGTPTAIFTTPGVISATWAVSIGTALESRLTLDLQSDGQPVGRVLARAPILAPAATGVSGRATLVADRAELVVTGPPTGWGEAQIDVAADLGAFAHQQIQEWGRVTGATTPDLAALLRATLAITTTEPALLEPLVRAQNADGGWGWWPGQPSASGPTLAALEALTDASTAGVAFSPTTLERGIRWFEQQTRGSTEHARFARVLAAQALPLPPAPLSDTATLDTPATAALLLALPAESAQTRPLLERLTALAERDGDRARWPASDTADAVVATAWAALALQHTLPDAELTRAAERELAASSATWQRGEHAGLALLALLAVEPRTGTTSAAITGLLPVVPVTSVLSLDLPLVRLAPRQTLTVTTTAAPVLARSRVTALAPEPLRAPILREYRDAATGAPLDATALRDGQLVQIRLTVVQEQRAAALTVVEPLGALVRPVAVGAGSGLALIASTEDRLVFGVAPAAPGVYTATYMARVIGTGAVSVPPPFLPAGGWGVAPPRVISR